ncbi:MAG: CoA transferase [Chloroflexi bacterium]|nr:CoA transferase [Chloroflexota bacterium]
MRPMALAGLRVVETGFAQAGPWVARTLGDYGASVIKVESKRRPDGSRITVFPDNHATPDEYWEQGGTHHEQHRNKMSLAMELDRPEGAAIFKKLMAVTDILIESYPPQVYEKFGLSYPALQEVNPKLIMLSTTGYGHTGPYSSYRSYGMMIEAMSGISWLTGYAGDRPRRGSLPYPDHISAYHGLVAVMAALAQRRRTGEGQWIDLAQYEVAVNAVAPALFDLFMNGRTPPRQGNADDVFAPNGCYPAQGDDCWIAITVENDEQWQAFCKVVGEDPWTLQPEFATALGRVQHRAALDRCVAGWTAQRDPAVCAQLLQEAGVPASKVNSIEDIYNDPHLRERHAFHMIQHSPGQRNVGLRPFPGPPAGMSETPGEIRMPAPMMGEHNEEILTGLLGYTPEEVQSLEKRGVIGKRPAYADAPPPTTLSLEEQRRRGHVVVYDPLFKKRLGI